MTPFIISILLTQSTTPAMDGVLSALRTHQFVGLGEQHQSVECHRFFRSIVANDEVHRIVRDIVVEFGNPIYQPVIDRYIAGQNVPRAELRKCWQNTSQLLVWDSPVYESFFQAVRQSNKGRPASEQLRIVFVDPPINWNSVRASADYHPFGVRSPDHYRILKREVIDKGRKAILIFGSTHLTKALGPVGKRSNLGTYLERNHPGRLYSVWPAFGERPSFIRSVPSLPIMFEVAGSALATESFGQFLPKGLVALKKVNGKTVQVPLKPEDFPATGEMVDAILYFGPRNLTAEVPRNLLQADYLRELGRRNTIMQGVFGIDLLGQMTGKG